nr:GNAT family N-acetyltransferase [Nocardioides thalensis]
MLIADLRRAWTEENHGGPVDDPGFEERFAAWADRERDQRITWLAVAGEQPVGMLNMLVFERMPWPGQGGAVDRPGSWGYVANVYVRAEQRNAGIGAQLVAACVEHADSNRFARIVLAPSERSVPFYGRLGFRPAADLMVRPSPHP